jgi:integrase
MVLSVSVVRKAPGTAQAAGDTLPATHALRDWDSALRAFLLEKQRRTGSSGTAEKYGHILSRFFAAVAKTPDQVSPAEVFAFTYGVGPSGREPSASTVGLRLAAISSLYGFLQRMELTDRNPCDQVRRPRTETPPPRGLDVREIRRLFSAIPDTCAGTRDRAIILTFLLTGRRRSEVMGLRAGDLSRNGAVYYTYRGKGGVVKRRELPEPCLLAILEALTARGKNLPEMAPEEPLFDVSAHGFYLNLRRHLRKAKLPEAGVHLLRHTAAKLRRDVGESVEAVSRFLDHSNLAVTTTYLRRLEGEQSRTTAGGRSPRCSDDGVRAPAPRIP